MTRAPLKRRRATRPSVQPQRADVCMDAVFRWLKLDEGARGWRAQRAFAQAAGPRLSERARAERLRGAILYVRVASSGWSQQLQALKGELLEKLHAIPGGEPVRDFRFTVGPLEELAAWSAAATPTPTPRPPAERAPPPSDELAQAIRHITDVELREQLALLHARLGELVSS